MNANDLEHFNHSELDGGLFRPHQAEGIALMAATPRTLCADPVGAGKTVQAAGLIAYLVEVNAVDLGRPVLWLTEGSALAEQTARELTRFLPGLSIRNLGAHADLSSRAREDKRRRAVAEPAHVKVMTFSQWKVRGHLWGEPLPAVILDEASALRGGGKLHEAVLAVTTAADRVHAFTATLYENDPVEVWHIYAVLGLPGLPDKEKFGRTYVEWREYDNRVTPWAWASAEAAARFRLLTAENYFGREGCVADLDRPECSRQDVWVPLSPAQTRAMASADRLDGLQRRQRQKDVTTGRVSGPSSRALEASRLINRLVLEDPTSKVLVIAESLDELDTIAKQLKGLRIGYVELRGETAKGTRPSLVEDFRIDPNLHVLLGSKVVERGLNLQFCGHLVSVGLPDNPARLDQAIGRIVRHGSPYRRVRHWVVLNNHEFDRRAVARLQRKQEQAAMLRSQTV